MADIDLFQEAYRNNLGRDASPEELQGWVNGQFGGGSVQDRLNQIAQSGEAQARNPQPNYSQPQQPTSHGYDDPGQSNPNGPTSDYSGALANAYQQYLGRQASPDEIQNWWSGSYGYGQGFDNFNQAREAIRTSGEAKARSGGQAPSPYYMDTSYWGGQGVKESDIFNFQTGQLNPGWARTAKGYERSGATGSTGGATQPLSDPYQFFMNLTKGKPPTPESLEAMMPELAKYGITLGSKGSRGWSDTIILPDGRTFDVIEGAGIGTGKGWVFNQNGGPGYTGGVGGGQLPGNQYSDPYTQLLEMLIKSRIGNLQGGYDDAMRQQYMSALQNRASSLGQGNAQLDQMMQYLQERFTDLKGPGYTGAENEVLRTQALDPMERDRSSAKQRLTERLAARGINQDSGVFQQAMLMLDNEFDAMRSGAQTQLASNELGRRENRAQRAEQIGGAIAEIPDARAREQLDVYSALEQLSTLARNEEEARSREAIQYGGVLSNLGPERMSMAMQAAGMGNTSGLSQTLSSLMGINQQQGMYNQANQSSLWSGLGSLAAIIARSGQSGLSGLGG